MVNADICSCVCTCLSIKEREDNFFVQGKGKKYKTFFIFQGSFLGSEKTKLSPFRDYYILLLLYNRIGWWKETSFCFV